MKTKTSKTEKATRRSYAKPFATREKKEIEFWEPLAKLYDSKEWDENGPVPKFYTELRSDVRRDCVDRFAFYAQTVADGKCPAPFAYTSSPDWLTVVRHVISFDLNYEYVPDITDELYPYTNIETLEVEGNLQNDTISAIDKYLVEGAALAKRINSESYSTWTKAIIALERLRDLNSHALWPTFTWPDAKENSYEKATEVIDLALFAQAQLWADWRVWNRLHRENKSETLRTKAMPKRKEK